MEITSDRQNLNSFEQRLC